MIKNRFVFTFLFSIFLLMNLAVYRHYTPSGFLKDYSHLKRSDVDKNTVVYVNETLPIDAYNKILVDPTVLGLHKKSKGQGINPVLLTRFAGEFREEIIRALTFDEAFILVEDPGEGVLQIRLALTDVISFEPIKEPFKTIEVTGLWIGYAAVEFEFLDALTGEVVFSGYATKKRERLKNFKKPYHWQKEIRHWRESDNILTHLAGKVRNFIRSQ